MPVKSEYGVHARTDLSDQAVPSPAPVRGVRMIRAAESSGSLIRSSGFLKARHQLSLGGKAQTVKVRGRNSSGHMSHIGKTSPALAAVHGVAVEDNPSFIAGTDEVLSRDALYAHLERVSRSFAITIPFMAEPMRDYVALAYLLCRIVDTVEDDAKAALLDKITWLSDFAFLSGDEFTEPDVLRGLRLRALDLVKDGSSEDDIALVRDLELAVNLLLSYSDEVQEIICHAVSILAHGMSSSLRHKLEQSEISNIDEVDSYCYFVAGVVGEMLAELFVLHDNNVDRKELMALAVSFGEGLQLTNILRDRAKDAKRGASFLPVSDADGVLEYVALTQGHLDDAISFICALSPHRNSGVRMFCFTNVAMAMYLLRQVARSPLDPDCNYNISRRRVKQLFFLSRFAVRSNLALRFFSFLLSFGMKRQRRNARQLRDKVSIWDHSSTTN